MLPNTQQWRSAVGTGLVILLTTLAARGWVPGDMAGDIATWILDGLVGGYKLYTWKQAKVVAVAAKIVPIAEAHQQLAGVPHDDTIPPSQATVLHDFGASIIIIALIVAALGGGFLLYRQGASFNIPLTREGIIQVERSYALLLVGVKSYKDACTQKLIEQTCLGIVTQLKADVLISDAAYKAVVPYEDMPPQDLLKAFVASVNVVKALVPVGYIPRSQ